eukprot:13812238-Alexandrium_andersonii.AAC.1
MRCLLPPRFPQTPSPSLPDPLLSIPGGDGSGAAGDLGDLGGARSADRDGGTGVDNDGIACASGGGLLLLLLLLLLALL